MFSKTIIKNKLLFSQSILCSLMVFSRRRYHEQYKSFHQFFVFLMDFLEKQLKTFQTYSKKSTYSHNKFLESYFYFKIC